MKIRLHQDGMDMKEGDVIEMPDTIAESMIERGTATREPDTTPETPKPEA